MRWSRKFKYAEVSHARIVRLDVTAARAIPGVFAVLTQDDVPDVRFGPFVQDRTLFARDVVRFEGEIVAAVAAIDVATAQRAVNAIVVEYAPLPVVNDIEDALAADAPLVHEGWAGYGAVGRARARPQRRLVRIDRQGRRGRRAWPRPTSWCTAGTWPTAATPRRSSPAPSSPSGRATRSPSGPAPRCRSTPAPACARRCRLPANRVRIIVPHLGGGFGGKCGFHYEAHVAALARATKRPVRLVFSRREEFLAPDRRREGIVFDFETGVKADGTITARKVWLAIDNGAYTADAGFFSQLAAMHALGPVPGAERLRRGPPRLHQPPAVGLGACPNGAADLLGAGEPHRRGRQGHRAWTPSSSG